MTELVLHIGPGKCGSSSLQNFFASQKNPCFEDIGYFKPNAPEISKLNCIKPSESLLATFAIQLSENLIGCDTLILSHEFLFQNPYTIANIVAIATINKLVTKVFIIGYSRRQSDFLISAYSQWLFRSQDRINEVTNTLVKFGIDPVLFTGLERQLIASVINDFHSARQLSEYSILDWHNSYNTISQLVREYGVEVKCGVLPRKESDIPLLEDFCRKAGLTLYHQNKAVVQKVSNVSFNQDIVEAINNAVTLGFQVPNPHEDNDIIGFLSSKMNPMRKNSSEFLLGLKSYIDTYYFDSNILLCNQYNLDKLYFLPTERFSKSEIIDIILNEGDQRSLDKSTIIKNNQMLSAKMIELCLKVTKDS